MDEKLAAAVEAIKGNLSSGGHHPYRLVNDTAATSALCRSLSIDEGEARQLCRAAVEQHLGGCVESRTHTGGLRAGRRRQSVIESWWVNVAEVA